MNRGSKKLRGDDPIRIRLAGGKVVDVPVAAAFPQKHEINAFAMVRRCPATFEGDPPRSKYAGRTPRVTVVFRGKDFPG